MLFLLGLLWLLLRLSVMVAATTIAACNVVLSVATAVVVLVVDILVVLAVVLAVGVVVVAMIAIVSVAVVREYFGCVGQAA